jgi:hypothetical protein
MLREGLTEWILVGFFGLALPLVALLWILLRPSTPPPVGVPPAELPGHFRRRRRRSLRIGFPLAFGGMALIMAGIYVAASDGSGPMPSSPAAAVSLFVTGLLAFAAGRLYLRSVYRCPACGDEIVDQDGWVLNPSSCPSCGTALR